jgi:cytochrome c oxidase subunit II
MLSFVQFRHGWPTLSARLGCAALLLPLGACAGEFSTLDPAGPAAARVAQLWWVMFAGAMLILAGIVAAALYSLKRERRGRDMSERRVLIGWGLVFPVVVLAALMAFAFLRGEQWLARPDPLLVVRVQAEQWSWTFEHPGGERIVGALHVPAGRPFHLRLTSRDVIHSVWVPRLGGKMDAIPGRENVIALQADAPGFYRGVCAEYCGVGHAHMMFEVHAHAEPDFAAALAAAAADDDGVPREPLPVLVDRRPPAGGAFGNAFDHVLRWLGLR